MSSAGPTTTNNMISAATMTVSASDDRLSALIPELRTEIFRLAVAPDQPLGTSGVIEDNFNIAGKIHPLAHVSQQLRREVLPLLFSEMKFAWWTDDLKPRENAEEHRQQIARQLHGWLRSFGEGIRFVGRLCVGMPPIAEFFGDEVYCHRGVYRTNYRLLILIRRTTIKAILHSGHHDQLLEIAHLTEAEAVAEAMRGVGDMIQGHSAGYGRNLEALPGEIKGTDVLRFGMRVDKKQSRQQYMGDLVAHLGLTRGE
jgi:hypothetical protein